MQSSIDIKGARVHNLKNIDVSIPRDKLVVLTGLSGSGKSSLAFDTMKYSFIGMAEVEDIDTVVTLSSAMVGTTDDEIMETIDLLAHYGITVETAKEDMSAYYDALGSDGYCGCDDSSMDDTQIIKELDKLIRMVSGRQQD